VTGAELERQLGLHFAGQRLTTYMRIVSSCSRRLVVYFAAQGVPSPRLTTTCSDGGKTLTRAKTLQLIRRRSLSPTSRFEAGPPVETTRAVAGYREDLVSSLQAT